MINKQHFAALLCLLVSGFVPALTPLLAQQPRYPFNDPSLPMEKRIDNLLSLMTVDEKIDCLSTNTGVPQLGVMSYGSSEGIHGVVQRQGYDRRMPITTTQFPQPPGMGESWDPELVRQAGGVEGYEARFITQTKKYNRQILMLWGPQADLARDPRWGRSEEVYGEDPFFNGTMVAAFARGLEGDDPKYWQAAPLLKHFLAVLGVLFGAFPDGIPGWRRQRRHGVLQRRERHRDGRQSGSQERRPRQMGRGRDFERWRSGGFAGHRAPPFSES